MKNEKKWIQICMIPMYISVILLLWSSLYFKLEDTIYPFLGFLPLIGLILSLILFRKYFDSNFNKK